jgi:mannose-6-phosphate isomerase class I
MNAITEKDKNEILNEIKKNNGILRLDPAWVARDFLPPGRRLGLPEEMYDLGERGGICERWIASTTKADNKVSVPYEGLSFVKLNGGTKVTLKDAVETLPEEIMGKDYAKNHKGLGRLPKIFDYEYRLPYHIHQMQQHAKLVGCNSKEEAYYFPEETPLGNEPDTYFGVHPYIADQKKYDLLLPHMIEWKDDAILQYARAFKQMPGDGFHVPSGTLHAPGTALTIELQEDSDVFAMLQAKTGKKIINKDLLFKDVRAEDKQKYGEKIILEMINWEVSGDPYFYENRHTPPVLIAEAKQKGGEEHWIFYNTNKFSGKRLTVHPGGTFISKDDGVYNILVWKGKGVYGGLDIEGGNFEQDEMLICHNAAVKGVEVKNTGSRDLIIYKFFGPDVNRNVPMLKPYKK